MTLSYAPSTTVLVSYRRDTQLDQKDDVLKAEKNRAREWEKWWIIDLRLGFLFLEMELTDAEREMQVELKQWGIKDRTVNNE